MSNVTHGNATGCLHATRPNPYPTGSGRVQPVAARVTDTVRALRLYARRAYIPVVAVYDT